MGEKLRKRTRRMATVLLIVAVGMVAQGCILESKEIIDVYDLVFGIPVGTSFVLNRMTFPFEYCFPAGLVTLSAAFSDPIADLTRLVVIAAILSAAGAEVERYSFPLRFRNGAYRNTFSVEGACIPAGGTLVWRVKPNATIPFGLSLRTRFFYRADEA